MSKLERTAAVTRVDHARRLRLHARPDDHDRGVARRGADYIGHARLRQSSGMTLEPFCLVAPNLSVGRCSSAEDEPTTPAVVVLTVWARDVATAETQRHVRRAGQRFLRESDKPELRETRAQEREDIVVVARGRA